MRFVRMSCLRLLGASFLSMAGTGALTLGLSLLPAGRVSADSSLPQTVVYTFGTQADDGGIPQSAIVSANDGSLYGTTSFGGVNGGGTIYRLDMSGAETTLYSFHSVASSGPCPDGASPMAALVEGPDGSFYGTTEAGGAHCNSTITPAGTVFKVTSGGTLTTLYSFCSTGGDACTDGALPKGSLVIGNDGALYGTTALGGASSLGSVFRITTDGQLTTLHSFCTSGAPACLDGAAPQAGLVLGNDGNFYGTTASDGQNGGGTVFSITPGGQLTTLYSFCDVASSLHCADGSYPMGGLVVGQDGNLYGTTSAGGGNIIGGTALSQTMGGTIFSITPTGTLTTLYSFCAQSGCTDGSQPLAGLTVTASGDFYGTTFQGGNAGTSSGASQRNNGTVFRLAADGSFVSIHSFCSNVQNDVCLDGRSPASGLTSDINGKLIGTTTDGGSVSGGDGFGTVYTLTAATQGGGGTAAPAASASGVVGPWTLIALSLLLMIRQFGSRSPAS